MNVRRFVNADQVIDLIYLEYLKANVSYIHDRRVETYPYARDAIREAVYNAIAHTCYMFGTPVQIRIEDEAFIISNQCILPDGWTVETLMEPHDSIPYNPDIANVFYRAGYIEHWGRGIEKICEACKELGADLPFYELRGNGLRVHFKALQSALVVHPKSPNRHDVGLDVGIANKILELVVDNPKITMAEMAERLNVAKRTIEREVKQLRETGRVERVGSKRFGYWKINN